MSIFKCKMCGGDLDITAGVTVCECEYCGSKQTVPAADNEKKMTLFGRANRLLRGCEFDKAAGIFESIVVDFPEEAEAYWGLVLCKYGIEYVDDPATARKVPTCHRSSFESVMDDANFDQACENADSVARRVYRDEAKAIEELRKGIIEVSGKEAPYDIFICYKETAENGERTLDSVMAQDVYDALTEKGYRVFFSRVTLEDKLGQEYEPYIFAALNSAKIMLAFGTDYDYYNAVWVKNEWSRFLQLIAKGERKTLIPCYKGLDAYDLPKEFAKLQAQDMGKVGAMQDLLRGIEKILPREITAMKGTAIVNGSQNNVAPLLERAFMFLEDGEWAKADDFCEQVLNQDPKNAQAYLGKLMVEIKVRTRDGLKSCEDQFASSNNYQKILRFGDEALKKEIESYNDFIALRIEEERREKAERENRAREERKKRIPELAQIREYLSDPACRVAISAGDNFTVGLRADGSVVACGYDWDGCCRDVQSWRDIVAISAGGRHTVGLCENGTVVACGYNYESECNVEGWRDIVAISAGVDHTVGLRADGSVVARGDNLKGQCNVEGWSDIVAIFAGRWYTVGLRADGSVVACGSTWDGQCDVQDWQDIVAISAGSYHTVGLRADGSVVACGENPDGQCDVQDWKLFQGIDDLRESIKKAKAAEEAKKKAEEEKKKAAEEAKRAAEEARKKAEEEKRAAEEARKKAEEEKRAAEEARKKAEEEKRQEILAQLNAEKEKLQEELRHLKGLFTGKQRKEIEAQIAEIDARLEKLG